jgi:hypothetical protein
MNGEKRYVIIGTIKIWRPLPVTTHLGYGTFLLFPIITTNIN